MTDPTARPASTDPSAAERAVDDALPDPVPSLRDLLLERLEGHRSTARQLADDGRPPPVLQLMGGPLGLAETVVPVAVFSAVYGITDDLRTSLIAAIVPTVLVAVWRIARRESLTTALSGVMAVAVGAFIAARTGRASDFFWPSVIKNAAYGLVYGGSAVIGWPLIGVLLGFVLGEGTGWRKVPARRRVYQTATWLWFAMFALRVVIQTPLLLANRTVALGAINIFLGLPLFLLTVWASWLVIRRVPVAHPATASVPDGGSDSRSDGGPDGGPEDGPDGGPEHHPDEGADAAPTDNRRDITPPSVPG